MMTTAIRVLYVDDEPSLLDIGRIFLEQSGDLKVTTAVSAADAIRLLEQERFDVIISDYQMPEKDGIQLLVEVRTRFGPVPFILFTGKGREEVVIQAINSGADFYLQKGGEPDAQFAELSHKVRQSASRKRAEDSLRESEEKYRHLIEHSEEAIVVVQNGMVKLANHKTIEFTGYSEQELRAMSIIEFIHPDDRALVMERYQMRLNGKESPSRYAFRLSTKDGNTRWVEISITAINWDGHPATLNFLTDITERKIAEEALKESEERFRTIIHSILFGIVVINAKTHIILDANDKALQMIGGNYDVVAGSVCHRFICPAECGKCPVTDLGQTIDSSERVLLTLKEEKIPILKSVIKTILGGTEVLIESFIDITGRKTAEDALRTSEEKYRKAFLTSPDSICITRMSDGMIVSANKGFADMTGYSEDEVIGKTSLEINLWKNPEDRRKIVEGLKAKGEVRDYEAHFLTRTGEIYGSMSASVIELDGVPHILNITRDISGRKTAEEKMQEAGKGAGFETPVPEGIHSQQSPGGPS